MAERMAKFDRLLALIHALADPGEGLTLDEMAERVGVDRRTAERMRNVIAVYFDLDERTDDRRKRFRIEEGLRRFYTRPTAAELAALAAEVEASAATNRPRSAQLASLLAKVRSAFDAKEKRRLDPDLDALTRLQRTMAGAGPIATVPPEMVATVQSAILAGACVEFKYTADEAPGPSWRRVIPYGLVHGPLPYLVGKLPNRDLEPTYFRFDRMTDVAVSEALGCAPEDWDLDAWLAESFGVWRDDTAAVVLRILPHAVVRGRAWRFHPQQALEELSDGSLRVRFTAGGLRELAEHLFTWGGDLMIEAPAELTAAMRERLAAARRMLR